MKKKLNIYENGDAYLEISGLMVTPLGVKPVKTYDVSDLSPEEVEKLKKNPKDKKLLKKAKKI